ncbi:uncharacterized protein LOC134057099 [Cinclus cinclus]|uniref:uncharacterized protein LOC134057099 n=1 Tax=Cinclus cinclus TaxID=127875 RepID=UPI002E12A258
MSHPQGVPGASLQWNHRPHPIPKSKRLRTKRERNAAKFGPKVSLWGSRRGPAIPPRWLQPPPWGGHALGSPLGPPKPVVITQNRLCHRGLFNHEVKSLDVRRLLTPGPCGDGPVSTPNPTEEGEVGGVPADVLKDLVASLASLLGSSGVFSGRELVSERRRSLVAMLRRHRRGPPDLGVFLAHRTPAQPPVLSSAGQGTPRTSWQEARPGPPGRAVSLGGWEVGDRPARTPSPLGAVDMLPPHPRTPSPIFGAPREQEVSLEFGMGRSVGPTLFLGVFIDTPPPHPQNPFSWSSAEDEEDETPGGLTRTWGGPGEFLPEPPPTFWRSRQPPQEEEEEEGGDEGWTPITPPAFSPDPPPWESPKPRATCGPPRGPRPPRAPKIWRTEASWDPLDPSSLLWELPESSRPPLTPPRLSRAPQIWSLEPCKASPDPLRPLWDLPNTSRTLWDPRPWSPGLPKAALGHPRPPRTPQLWNPEPPRAPLAAPRPLWDPPGAPRPLWDSPDPPRSPRNPELWSPEPPWDPLAPPRPSRDPRPWNPDPPGVPQDTEPSRCCCCRRLYRNVAQQDPLCRHQEKAACKTTPAHWATRTHVPVFSRVPILALDATSHRDIEPDRLVDSSRRPISSSHHTIPPPGPAAQQQHGDPPAPITLVPRVTVALGRSIGPRNIMGATI